MDRTKFYAALRARNSGVFGTSLSASQVATLDLILDEGQARGVPLTQLAYIMATPSARSRAPCRALCSQKGHAIP
ncbi:MAG: hypothetical protein E5W82_24800 [Mesorhizobium sp.]|nr:MAG: hypothetical protein E5W82_24800 [Mesorhizobium sp.]TJW44413.1 MAG: hypothetical protein E5W83_14390 [Mesorhizobium sp.]